MNIVPAILTTSPADFIRQIERLLSFCNTFQIDVQDGIFVPSKTLSLTETLSCLSQITFPKGVKIDIHLMIFDYSEALKEIYEMKNTFPLQYVLVHQNIPPHVVIQSSLHIIPVFNPPEEPESNLWGKKIIDFSATQIMTIFPGPQGQKFMPDQLQKIGRLRKMGFMGKIYIDGSVNEESLFMLKHIVAQNLPTDLGIGSYLSQCSDTELASRITHIQMLCGEIMALNSPIVHNE